ncbi:hypothetical protein [Nonomuraea sp. NPDC050783]|uniref:hypothetical protein n=1 Tax=Nonomuraea sp. NPDC050783 TaxID=3154634 RepID=UPI00346735D6
MKRLTTTLAAATSLAFSLPGLAASPATANPDNDYECAELAQAAPGVVFGSPPCSSRHGKPDDRSLILKTGETTPQYSCEDAALGEEGALLATDCTEATKSANTGSSVALTAALARPAAATSTLSSAPHVAADLSDQGYDYYSWYYRLSKCRYEGNDGIALRAWTDYECVGINGGSGIFGYYQLWTRR